MQGKHDILLALLVGAIITAPFLVYPQQQPAELKPAPAAVPMDTVSLASFVALTKTPAPIPTELQTDAQTATACMVAIQYQLDALSGLAAKWGVQALCGAMGEDKSPLAMSVLTSLGPDWKSGVDAKAEALQAAQTAEQPAEVKP